MSSTAPASRYDLSRDDVAALLHGEARYRTDQLWDGLLRGDEPEAVTALPKALRVRLQAEPALAPALRESRVVEADGGATAKWLWDLRDGRQVETVLMTYPGWATVCVSSQAGCAMGCGFCATGQAGFDRHLTRGEIVEQVVRARAFAVGRGRRLTNVVFMGMGEPMVNYDSVWGAVERLHDDIGLSARHITISTVGVIPGIRRLAGESLPVNLAVSLHAANDDLRDELVPINRRYPISDLMDACHEYLSSKRRRLSFEWALIDGVNDRDGDADELADLARPLRAHVNVIPLNPTPGWPTKGSPAPRVRAFRDRLRAHGVNATVRQNRGTGIDAACGQLRAAATGEVPVSIGRLPD